MSAAECNSAARTGFKPVFRGCLIHIQEAMNSALASNAFTVHLNFHGDLSFFLGSRQGRALPIEKVLREKTSVKDAIESCGVPHTEVDLILANGDPVTFAHHLVRDEEVDIYPVSAPPGLFPTDRLQQRAVTRFVADGHLGKLVRDLRLLGIDVRYDNDASDAQLLITVAPHGYLRCIRDS